MDFEPNNDNNFNEMLNDVYCELDSLNSNTTKLIIPDPVLERTPTKTYWKNIKQMLQKLNRSDKHSDHFIEFLNKELKTGDWISSSKSDGIVMIGKFNTKQIMHVISEYVKKYVICNICISTDTTIDKNKELRSYSISCNKCKSQYIIN